MSRGSRALVAALIAFAVWVALLQYVEGDVFDKILLVRCTPLELHSILAEEWMLLMYAYDLQAPVLMVLAFALYCLASLVHGVLTFRTVPAEAKLLQQVLFCAAALPVCAAGA